MLIPWPQRLAQPPQRRSRIPARRLLGAADARHRDRPWGGGPAVDHPRRARLADRQGDVPGHSGDARGVLIVVSATMITTTGIVFSLTVLSLQIASSQFSVRLLRTFLRDVPNQVVLAIFVCTFAYATGGLLTVGEHAGGGAFVPRSRSPGRWPWRSSASAHWSSSSTTWCTRSRSTRSWKVSSAAHSRWWTICSQIRITRSGPARAAETTDRSRPAAGTEVWLPADGGRRRPRRSGQRDGTLRATCGVCRRLRHGRQQQGLVLAQGSG